MGSTPNITQASFRGREDDGSEITATWKANANTNWSQATGATFRVRFLITSTGTAGDTVSPQLQYNHDAGGWNNVTGASSKVKGVNSANITNQEATTQQVGVGTFIAGNVAEEGLTADVGLTTASETEVEYVLQCVSADLAGGGTIQLRVTDAGVALTNYTNTPSITLIVVPADGDLDGLLTLGCS
jgi:hypothetical protein